MRPDRSSLEVRAELDRLAKSRAASLAALSRMIHKPDRYLDTFVREGRPEWLDDRDIADLSAFFGVEPWKLGKRWAD